MSQQRKRVGLYVRVSTEEQSKNFSIPAQKEELLAECAKRGWEVVDVYVDAGISGSELERPELQRLLADASQHRLDWVLAKTLDRLSRDVGHLNQLLRAFKESGVQVEFLDMQVDGSPTGEFLTNVRASVAQYERRQFLERSRTCMLQRVKGGKFSGGMVIFGYDYVKQSGHFVINEEQADGVRTIFRLCNEENMSGDKIAVWLNAKGVKAKYGGAWCSASIHRILRNRAYCGEAFYNKNREVKGRKNPRPREEWLPFSIPPIIDQAILDKAGERRKMRKRYSHRNRIRHYLLTGLLHCGECERRMNGTTDPRWPDKQYYFCPGTRASRAVGSPKCLRSPIRADKLDGEVWGHVVAIFQEPEIVLPKIEEHLRLTTGAVGDVKKKLEKIAAQKVSLRNQSRRIETAYREGYITLGSLSGHQHELKQKETLLQQEQDAIELAMKDRRELQERVRSLGDYYAQIRDRIQSLSPSEKEQVVREIVTHVEVDMAGGVAVRMLLPPPKAEPLRSKEGLSKRLLKTAAGLVVGAGLLGSVDWATRAHPREVFEPALRVGAVAIILAHNHPSGDPQPSDEDVALTRRLAQAGTLLGIDILDHIVVTAEGYLSLRDARLL